MDCFSLNTDVQIAVRSLGTAVLSGSSVFMRHLFRGANAAGPPNRASSISHCQASVMDGWTVALGGREKRREKEGEVRYCYERV